MKKISVFFIISLLITSVNQSFAVNEKVQELRQEIKNTREEVKLTRTSTIQQNKELRQENRLVKAKATTSRLRQGIVARYENTLKHKANIEARIAKVGANRDLTAAKAELAKFSDAKYKADLVLFDAKVAEVLASSTPLKLTPELKAISKTLDTDLKTMRTTLADTLRLIIKAR